jgi:hypothetical protein
MNPLRFTLNLKHKLNLPGFVRNLHLENHDAEMQDIPFRQPKRVPGATGTVQKCSPAPEKVFTFVSLHDGSII